MRCAEKSSITKWWLCTFSSISILLKGFVCQLIFTGAQEAQLHIWDPVLCSSFWWQNAKVEHAMPNIPESSSTIATVLQGIQRRKNAPFFMGKRSRPTWLFDSMFHKAIKMCSNSHIYISSRLARTTYRAMPQINPLIHIHRDFFPML